MGNIKQTRITLRKGLKSDLPSHAPLGEPLYCIDTHELYVGMGDTSNILQISDINTIIELTKCKIKSINVNEYGFKNDGISDNTFLFNKLLEDNKDVNTLKLYFEKGDYVLNDVKLLNKNIILEGEDIELTRIYSTLDCPAITFESNYSQVQSVASIERNHGKTILTFNSSKQQYHLGDIIKVVSEDLEIISPLYNSKARYGEYFSIEELQSNCITLSGDLNPNLKNNVRIGVQGQHCLKVRDISFGTKNSNLSQLTPLLRVKGGSNHMIDTNILFTPQIGVEFLSCYTYNCNIRSKYQTSDPNNFKFGYTVIDKGSFGFNINFNCNSVRHPFTDSPTGILNNDLFYYGISQNYKLSGITNGRCQASLDTHRFTKDGFITNSRILNNSLVGLNLRNSSTIVDNIYIRTYIGLKIDSLELQKANHIIKNSYIESEKECSITGNDNLNVTFRNSDLIFKSPLSIIKSKVTLNHCTITISSPIKLNNSKICCNNCTFILDSTNSIFDNLDSQVNLLNCTVIFIGENSYNNRIMSVLGKTFKLFSDKITFINERNSTKLTGISVMNEFPVVGSLTLKNILIDGFDERIQVISGSSEFEKWCNGANSVQYPNIKFINSYN